MGCGARVHPQESAWQVTEAHGIRRCRIRRQGMHGFLSGLPLRPRGAGGHRCTEVSGCRGALDPPGPAGSSHARARALMPWWLDRQPWPDVPDRGRSRPRCWRGCASKGLSALPGPKAAAQLQEAALPSPPTISATAGRIARTLPCWQRCLTGWPSSCRGCRSLSDLKESICLKPSGAANLQRRQEARPLLQASWSVPIRSLGGSWQYGTRSGFLAVEAAELSLNAQTPNASGGTVGVTSPPALSGRHGRSRSPVTPRWLLARQLPAGMGPCGSAIATHPWPGTHYHAQPRPEPTPYNGRRGPSTRG